MLTHACCIAQVHAESGGSITAREAVVIATNSPISQNCESLNPVRSMDRIHLQEIDKDSSCKLDRLNQEQLLTDNLSCRLLISIMLLALTVLVHARQAAHRTYTMTFEVPKGSVERANWYVPSSAVSLSCNILHACLCYKSRQMYAPTSSHALSYNFVLAHATRDVYTCTKVFTCTVLRFRWSTADPYHYVRLSGTSYDTETERRQ